MPSIETSGDTGLSPMPGDGLLVGRDQRAFVQRQPLRPEEHFGGAQDAGVLAAVEHVAQDHMDELVEEQRRRAADAAAHQIEIGRLRACGAAADGRGTQS